VRFVAFSTGSARSRPADANWVAQQYVRSQAQRPGRAPHGKSQLNADEYDLSLSVTTTLGAKPCFLSSLRVSFLAAALFCLRCTRTSRTSPSSSTARHRYIRLPPMRTTISSRCHRELGRGRRRRSRRANAGPNFSTQRQMVSYETSGPRCASNSSTSR